MFFSLPCMWRCCSHFVFLFLCVVLSSIDVLYFLIGLCGSILSSSAVVFILVSMYHMGALIFCFVFISIISYRPLLFFIFFGVDFWFFHSRILIVSCRALVLLSFKIDHRELSTIVKWQSRWLSLRLPMSCGYTMRLGEPLVHDDFFWYLIDMHACMVL